MDALILAAGYGSRLRDVAPCKPLARVGGVPLIEIAIRQFALAGASRVVVATGYLANEVEAALPAIAKRVGVDVIARRVADFRQPNGYSVLDGSRDFEGRFLLAMADHILSSDLVAGLIAQSPDDAGAVLAIDRRVDSPLVDPDDATWVQLGERDAIAKIGKGLERFDAVDCGVFLATPELPRAIETAIAQGRAGSLSDGMQVLANRGRARTVDIGDAWWIDVDDEKALRLAEAELGVHLPHLFPGPMARIEAASA